MMILINIVNNCRISNGGKGSIIVGFNTEYMKTYESDVTIYKKKRKNLRPRAERFKLCEKVTEPASTSKTIEESLTMLLLPASPATTGAEHFSLDLEKDILASSSWEGIFASISNMSLRDFDSIT